MLNRRTFIKTMGAIGVGIGGISLAGCAAQPAPTSTPSKTVEKTAAPEPTKAAVEKTVSKEAKPVHLRVWDFKPDLVNEKYRPIVEKCTGVDITFDWKPATQWGEIHSKEFIGKDSIVDVMYVLVFDKDVWYNNRWIESIEHVEPSYLQKETFPAPYEACHGPDKKLNAMPYFFASMPLMVNSGLLEKAGYDLEESWNRDEFREIMLKAKEKGLSEYPVHLGFCATHPEAVTWMGSWVYSIGGRFFDDKYRPIMDQESSKVMEAINDIKTWFLDDKLVNEDSFTTSSVNDTSRVYCEGRTLFTCGPDYRQKFCSDPEMAVPEMIGMSKIARMPGTTHDALAEGGYYVMTFATGEEYHNNWDESWQVMEGFGGRCPGCFPGQDGCEGEGDLLIHKNFALDSGLVPIYKPLWEDPEVVAGMASWVDVPLLKKILEEDTKFFMPNHQPWVREWATTMMDKFQKAVYGMESIEDAMEDMAARTELIQEEKGGIVL